MKCGNVIDQDGNFVRKAKGCGCETDKTVLALYTHWRIYFCDRCFYGKFGVKREGYKGKDKK